MPCNCGGTRLIFKKIMCPNCDHIQVVNPANHIAKLEAELVQLHYELKTSLSMIDPEVIINHLLLIREESAKNCLSQKYFRHFHLKRWLAITNLLTKYPWNFIEPCWSDSLFIESLIYLSELILDRQNKIFKLKKELLTIILDNGTEKFVQTEKSVLAFIPEAVLEEYSKVYSDFNDLNNYLGNQFHMEVRGIKDLLVQPDLPWAVGEELFRELKQIYPRRLLSKLNPNNIKIFQEISATIVGFIALLLGQNFTANQGLLKIDAETFSELKKILVREQGQDHVEWYLNQLSFKQATTTQSFSNTLIVSNEKSEFFFPYFSLTVLIYICSRWDKNPDKGRYLNYIGSLMEDLIFSHMRAYAINTQHPLSNESLVRVPHPDNKDEIADVMGYNDKTLIVIESKFRETSSVTSIEIELEKFLTKVNYIKTNLEKFGFNKDLDVKPIFYTPYPPFCEWKGIELVPSLVFMSSKFWELFGTKKIELIMKTKEHSEILSKIDEPTPYPLDVSIIDSSFEENIYRIQDGVIDRFSEKEVTIIIDNPIGNSPSFIIVDITKEIYQQLLDKKIRKGDLVKTILFNINGTWSMIQLVDFRLIHDYKSNSSDLNYLDLLTQLKSNSREKSIEKFIRQTYNEKLADEILETVKRWKIDLTKFIEQQKNKGQNVWIGIGKMLGLSDHFDFLAQCKCGEVIGLTKEMVEIFTEIYPNGIECKKCDPIQIERIEKASGLKLGNLDQSVLLKKILKSFSKNFEFNIDEIKRKKTEKREDT